MNRPLTGVKISCPVSGLLVGGVKIPQHFIDLKVCLNEHRSLYAFCQVHRARVFIGDATISKFICSTIPNLEEEIHGQRR